MVNLVDEYVLANVLTNKKFIDTNNFGKIFDKFLPKVVDLFGLKALIHSSEFDLSETKVIFLLMFSLIFSGFSFWGLKIFEIELQNGFPLAEFPALDFLNGLVEIIF